MPSFVHADRRDESDHAAGRRQAAAGRGRAVDEAISQLFHFELDLITQEASIAFDQLLGQKVTMEWRLGEENDSVRYFNGIVSRFAQGERAMTFTRYPHGRGAQALAAHAQGAEPHLPADDRAGHPQEGVRRASTSTYELQGTFEPRDYCVQYRETDFDFASRLMEEEGIYYFFKHERGHATRWSWPTRRSRTRTSAPTT